MHTLPPSLLQFVSLSLTHSVSLCVCVCVCVCVCACVCACVCWVGLKLYPPSSPKQTMRPNWSVSNSLAAAEELGSFTSQTFLASLCTSAHTHTHTHTHTRLTRSLRTSHECCHCICVPEFRVVALGCWDWARGDGKPMNVFPHAANEKVEDINSSPRSHSQMVSSWSHTDLWARVTRARAYF